MLRCWLGSVFFGPLSGASTFAIMSLFSLQEGEGEEERKKALKVTGNSPEKHDIFCKREKREREDGGWKIVTTFFFTGSVDVLCVLLLFFSLSELVES